MNPANACLLLTVLLGALWPGWAAITGPRPAHNSATANASACFEVYLHSMSDASSAYARNYGECLEKGTSSRMLFAQQKQPLREQVANEAAALCANIEHCNALPADMDYFQCNVQQSAQNINTLIGIKLDSSAAIVELEEQYDQAEREMLLCIIEVQRVYVATSTDAYQTLAQCL